MRDESSSGLLGAMWRGAAAGAAGTTALNALTDLDIAWRGRPPSSTPEQTVERIADRTGIGIPGDEDQRRNRVGGLGALSGMATGIAAGVVVGALAQRMRTPSFAKCFGVAAATVLVAGNAPMTALGVTDPRTWSATDWISDVVPPLGYALVAASVVSGLSSG